MQLTVSLFLALSITQSCSFRSAGSTGCFRPFKYLADLDEYQDVVEVCDERHFALFGNWIPGFTSIVSPWEGKD
jgi:hypothetical protein